MSQISPPIRILLVATIGLVAAYSLFLRPKDAAPAPSAATPGPNLQTGAPAQSAPGKAAQAAKAAVAKANGATAATERAAGEQPATGEATGTVDEAPQQALPAVDPALLATLPERTARALRAHKLLVVGIIETEPAPYAGIPDDDRLVRDALARVNRYHGDVVVETVPVARISRYATLLSGAQVTQAPAIVVVDRNLRATRIDGWLDRVSINQAIADARRASTPQLITDPYLRKVNSFCGQYLLNSRRLSYPTARGAERAWFRRAVGRSRAFSAKFAAIEAPARWRGLKGQIAGALRAETITLRKLDVAAARRSPGAFRSALAGIDAGALEKLDRRLDAVGISGCVATRRS